MYRSVVGMIGGVSGGWTRKHGSSRRTLTEGHRRTRKHGSGSSGGRSARPRGSSGGGEVGSGDREGVLGGGGVVRNEQDAIIKEGRSEWGKKDGMQVESGVGREGRGRSRDGAGKKADGDRFENRLP
jgi:hypothetical protein